MGPLEIGGDAEPVLRTLGQASDYALAARHAFVVAGLRRLFGCRSDDVSRESLG